MANISTTSNYSNGRLPSASCTDNPTAEIVAKTSVYSVLIVVAVTGNILIGLVVFKTKSMRRTINFLIVNMAFSDLILPIIAFPQILTHMHVGHWLIDGRFGLTLCKITNFLQDVSLNVSIQSLVLISVDRFGAVVFPLRPPIVSSKLCPYVILATWIVAIAIHCPHLFAFNLIEIEGELQCQLLWNETFEMSSSKKQYYLAVVLVVTVIPFALMTIIYSIIIFKLRSQKIPGNETMNAKQQKKRLRRQRNVLKMSLAIVLVFGLCWAPINIILFLTYFVWDKNVSASLSCGFQAFYFFALFMAYANCAINPCICFNFSGNFRKGLKRLFECFLKKCNCPCFGVMRSKSWNVQR